MANPADRRSRRTGPRGHSRASGICVGMMVLAVALSACGMSTVPSRTTQLPATASGEGFRLYVLNGKMADLNLGYTRESSWSVLSKVDLAANRMVITQDGIESYDWAEQTITLTLDATKAIVAIFPPPGTFSLMIGVPFVVALDGERIYGGVFMVAGYDAKCEMPIILGRTEGNRIQLQIRPQLIRSGIAYASYSPADRAQIEIPKIRAFFSALGKLA
jgi:hypothetical protein